MARARRPWLRAVTATAAVGFVLVCYVYVTLPDVRDLAEVNPTTTAFMELRGREAAADGREARHLHRWVPYSRISSHLKRAVLVAEDSAFWDHEGVDVDQIRRSIQDSLARGEMPRGASTITQQLAKNLYLSPSYDPLRKLRELILARRLEVALTKARIFEIYLNVIEWGDEVWGAEAAARTYFGTPAASLSRTQSALLAGAIINPRLLDPARPTRRLLRRQRLILARMGSVAPTAPVVERAPEPDRPEPEEATPRFELSLDEEEAEGTDEPAEPDAPAVEPPPEETPPA
jgi:monofunctional biosynthetic peptidoglycan transglycosylase